LRNHQCKKQTEELGRYVEISPLKRHGNRVAAGLAQRCCGYFDAPEDKGDFRDFAELTILGPVIN
jgi:hypothetical protein